MKNHTRLLAALLLTLVFTGLTPAFAAEASVPVEVEVTAAGEIVPFADEWITYYRTYNGIKQYRIWNATWGYWMNDWTVCV